MVISKMGENRGKCREKAAVLITDGLCKKMQGGICYRALELDSAR